MTTGPSGSGTSLADIERLAAAYARALADVERRKGELETEIAALKRRHKRGLDSLMNLARATRAELKAAVEAAPELFRRPKTRVLHDIRVGWVKGKGKLCFANPAAVVAAIRRLFPDRAPALVKVTEAPVRAALARLPAADLKRLGISVEDTAEAPVAEATKSDIEKWINARMAGPDEDEPAPAQAGEAE